jgi:hypothetical protein
MSNLEKWIRAILHEDLDKLSIGSVRTLQLIRQEFQRLQTENKELKKMIATTPTTPKTDKDADELTEAYVLVSEQEAKNAWTVGDYPDEWIWCKLHNGEHLWLKPITLREQRGAEHERLKDWKESAMKVMPDYQELGKLMGVPLGESVHDKIIPYIKKLQDVIRDDKRLIASVVLSNDAGPEIPRCIKCSNYVAWEPTTNQTKCACGYTDLTAKEPESQREED